MINLPPIRPTLADLVPQYVAVGITPRNAVHYVIDSHMRAVVARGKGYKASKRVQRLLDRIGRNLVAQAERLRRERERLWADERAEMHSEARRHSKLADIVNFHE